MICPTTREAQDAAEKAKEENLHGLYPSATRVLSDEVFRHEQFLRECWKSCDGMPSRQYIADKILAYLKGLQTQRTR